MQNKIHIADLDIPDQCLETMKDAVIEGRRDMQTLDRIFSKQTNGKHEQYESILNAKHFPPSLPNGTKVITWLSLFKPVDNETYDDPFDRLATKIMEMKGRRSKKSKTSRYSRERSSFKHITPEVKRIIQENLKACTTQAKLRRIFLDFHQLLRTDALIEGEVQQLLPVNTMEKLVEIA